MLGFDPPMTDASNVVAVALPRFLAGRKLGSSHSDRTLAVDCPPQCSSSPGIVRHSDMNDAAILQPDAADAGAQSEMSFEFHIHARDSTP